MAASGLSVELQRFFDLFQEIPREMHKHIVGADQFIEMFILILLAGSGRRKDEKAEEYHTHLLTESDVGEGKTAICKAFAATLDMSFSRIQFERDLKPQHLKQTKKQLEDLLTQAFAGPLNANIVLADELTRSGGTVHTALIEAMAEGILVLPDITYRTPRPYMVIATANAIDWEGVSRPGTAVSDRFTFRVDSPEYTPEERKEIARGQEERAKRTIAKVASCDDVLDARDCIFANIFVSEELLSAMERLTRRCFTKNLFQGEDSFGKYGASGQRPLIFLYRAARARAFMLQRMYVIPEDIEFLAYPLLRHRVDFGFGVRGLEKRRRIEKIVQEVLRDETAGIARSANAA